MEVDLNKVDANYIRQLSASVARDSFYHFIRLIKPDYIFSHHHIVLIEALQRLSERKYKRLVVMMPPRHGKSELVSRLFPAWCFAKNCNEQVIVASYSLDLASAMNRDCQKVLSSTKYVDLFPNVSNNSQSDVGFVRTSKRFDIVGGAGYYLAAGVGGGITGAGATVAIIDDPVKNAEEADSTTYRNKTFDWYRSTFYTRLEPGAIEVICQTRWHEDDLAGRVLKGSNDSTEVISMPALAEVKDDYRNVGDALWSGKYDRTALLSIKKDVGTRSWNALYQQKPGDLEGGMIKKANFSKYDIRKYDYSGKAVNFFFDTAYTDNERNDPMAGIAYVKEGADFYVLDCISEWLEFPEQIDFVRKFSKKNGYSHRSIIRVEPKASGQSVVQVLKKSTALNIKNGRSPKESKIARVNSVSPAIEAGRVFLPEGMLWVEDFLTECAAFPNAAHDDKVDCLTGMLMNEGIGSLKIHY